MIITKSHAEEATARPWRIDHNARVEISAGLDSNGRRPRSPEGWSIMSERLSAEQLAEIRERAEKATAGPWVVYCPRGTRYHVKNFKGAFILEHLDPHDIRRGADSEFIAHARTDIPALLADRDVLEAERERLLNLVRYCRHELLDKDLITQDEFASILQEGSAAKLETYDQLRAQIAAADALHLATVEGKVALEAELQRSQNAHDACFRKVTKLEAELNDIRDCDKCDLCEDCHE